VIDARFLVRKSWNALGGLEEFPIATTFDYWGVVGSDKGGGDTYVESDLGAQRLLKVASKTSSSSWMKTSYTSCEM